MAPASNEEQFKFLISCIRYSNNGKVDFGQVANECKIVSKGAAAKRYERMMRSHGIAPNAASIKPAPNRASKSEFNNFRSPSSTLRKRKAEAYLDENTVDDDEGFESLKAEPNTKEEVMIKGEDQRQSTQSGLDFEQAANLIQYYDLTPSYKAEANAETGGLYIRDEYFDKNGYTSEIGAPLTCKSPQPYGHSNFYSSRLDNTIKSEAFGSHFQPVSQYSSNEYSSHLNSPFNFG